MDERLRTLQAETEEEQTLRRKRDSLEVEYRSLCSYERELAVLRQKEQEDVARMEQGGVRNLFTKVTGKYGEALAQEQAEAAETETKYRKVQREIAQMEDTLRQLDKRIGELSSSQARYDAYILQRAEELEGAGTDSGTKDLQARIRTLEEQARILLEKRNRLADVRWEVRNVLVRRGCPVWMNDCAHCRQKRKRNRLCVGSGTAWKWNTEVFAVMKGNWRCCVRKNRKMWRGWSREAYGISLRK